MNIRRVLSALLILAMLSGLFANLAAAAQKNIGTRDEVCTTLSSQATAYYAKNGFTYDTYAALAPGNESCLQTVNSEMYKALRKLMTDTTTSQVSYSSLTSCWKDTDCENGTYDATLFYCDTTSGNYSRGQVWPNSRASFLQQDGGADVHHLRPTNSAINSARSSFTMGNVRSKYSSCSTEAHNGKEVLWYNPDHTEAGKCIGLVEVSDNIKGDVARIFLYVYTRWKEPNLFENAPNPTLSPSDNENSGIKVIESLDTLLQWCRSDPVDTWEMSRNDACQSIVGNRNIFIDYPEFAWLMFARTLPADMITPSGISEQLDTCPHTATETKTTAPTCFASGQEVRICTLCGKRLTSTLLPEIDHIFADGACTMCGESESSVLSQTFVLTDKVEAGDDVVIVCAAKNIAFSARKVNTSHQCHYNAGVNVAPVNGKIFHVPDEIIWTVGRKDGNYTFSHGGQRIGMGKEYFDTNFGEIYNVWAAENAETDGASYIKNVGRNVYLEWYEQDNHWCCYRTKSAEELFAMNFYVRYDPSDEPPFRPTEPDDKTDAIERGGFDDVREEDWFHGSVVFAVENGLMNGVGGNRFAPNGDVTRGMLVTILYRSEGKPEVDGMHNPFRDVEMREWYAKAIIWAAENKIVNGMSQAVFAPNAAITREQIATILYRYADFCGRDVEGYEDEEIEDFSDCQTVSRYAKKAVNWAVAAGIVNGMDGRLAPTASATRAQLAAMLERYLKP